MLLLAKVPKRGALTIVGVVACILGFVTGMHWGMDLGCLIMLAVADILAGIGQYRNKGPEILVIMVLGTFIVAAVSGTVGNLLMKKQFEKAGVAA